MHTITTIMLVGFALAVLPADLAEAQHSEQLTINQVGALSADGNVIGSLDRQRTSVAPANQLDLTVARILCTSPSTSVGVEVDLRDPTKVVDKRTKVEVEQGGYPFLEITGITGGPATGQPENCQAKVSGFDKDRDGALGGPGDLMKFSIKCKPGLAAEMGLDATQTAELQAAFGTKMTCAGAGPPDL